MKRAAPYLQAAAVASAVTLMGAFVAYRAGAFPNPFASPSPQPETIPAAAPQTESEQPLVIDIHDPAIMYSSKSAPAFTSAQPTPASGTAPGQQPAPTPESKPPTFMGGSKYITIVPPNGQAVAPPPPTTPKP